MVREGKTRMSERTNTRVRLKSQPNGVPQTSDFGIRLAVLPRLAEGELLIRNEFLSVDPAMRGWICDTGGCSAQIGPSEAMRLSSGAHATA
jgi:NADPH-dependent curcumin reductase